MAPLPLKVQDRTQTFTLASGRDRLPVAHNSHLFYIIFILLFIENLIRDFIFKILFDILFDIFLAYYLFKFSDILFDNCFWYFI